MADKPIENLVYEFLEEHKDVFPDKTAIHGTAYESRKGEDHGIIVGDADTSMLPNGNEDDMTEFNGILTLEIFARVEGEDKTDRLPTRQMVFDIKKALLQLLETFPDLDRRSCKVRYLEQVRFFDDRSAEKWGIERVPLVCNLK